MDEVKQIVKSFEMEDSGLESEIERIITSWRNSFNHEEYNILLKILSNYKYYSKKTVGQTYKNIIQENFSTEEMDDSENLYLPLSTKDIRTESSEILFFQFIMHNEIDTNYTKFANSAKELQEIYDAWLKYSDIVDADGNLVDINDDRIRKELERDYIGVKQIFLIDDFVGTGKSVSNFIEANHININNLNFIRINFLFIGGTNFGLNNIREVIEKYDIENVYLYFLEEFIEFFDLKYNNNILSQNEIDIIKEKLDELYRDHNICPGHYNRNTAISSFYNAPNCNIPLLINSTDTWEALFERKKRIKSRNIDKSILKDNLRMISNERL